MAKHELKNNVYLVLMLIPFLCHETQMPTFSVFQFIGTASPNDRQIFSGD